MTFDVAPISNSMHAFTYATYIVALVLYCSFNISGLKEGGPGGNDSHWVI